MSDKNSKFKLRKGNLLRKLMLLAIKLKLCTYIILWNLYESPEPLQLSKHEQKVFTQFVKPIKVYSVQIRMTNGKIYVYVNLLPFYWYGYKGLLGMCIHIMEYESLSFYNRCSKL